MISHPFLSIWTRPRETVRTIIAENPGRYVWLLAGLNGLEGQLHRNVEHGSAQYSLPLSYALGLAFLVGVPWGFFTLWLGSLLIYWTGRWLGGTGDTRTLRTALAWSVVPQVVELLVWLIFVALYGTRILTGSPPLSSAVPGEGTAKLIFLLCSMVLVFWSLVLMCNTVAEVQGFRSAWRGLLNLFLMGVVLFIPVIILLLVFVSLYRR